MPMARDCNVLLLNLFVFADVMLKKTKKQINRVTPRTLRPFDGLYQQLQKKDQNALLGHKNHNYSHLHEVGRGTAILE
jgi:hypothetical protein